MQMKKIQEKKMVVDENVQQGNVEEAVEDNVEEAEEENVS